MATVLGLALVSGSAGAGLAQGPTTSRVSVATDGSQGNGSVLEATISANGRFVAFASNASNLTPFDTNIRTDIFVRDLVANTTERMSVPQGGGASNNDSRTPAISADGRFVAFESWADNLVPNDTNNRQDVFVRDRLAGTTERVSIGSNGEQAEGHSSSPSLSADGRFVAFASQSSNFVRNDTNAANDVFLRDRQKGNTELISVAHTGGTANSESFRPVITRDAQYVAFASAATNLTPNSGSGGYRAYVRNRLTNTTELVSRDSNGASVSIVPHVAINDGGRFVVFTSSSAGVPDDTNGKLDVYVSNRVTGVSERISVGLEGGQGNDHSGDSGNVLGMGISADGRLVSFASAATNLVPRDVNASVDVFVRDRIAATTELISVPQGGGFATGNSQSSRLSSDGRLVSFLSDAANLVSGDTNAQRDAFVRDRASPVNLPTLSVQNDRVTKVDEGSAASPGTVNFQVTLSRSIRETVTFQFWTTDVSARDGADYHGTFGTATILPGATQTTIPVLLFGDSLFEPNETFLLNIDMANNATILDHQATGMIGNDDPLTLGILELTPPNARLTPDERVLYSLEWTVPSGSWTDLKTIELRVGASGEVLWVAFDEARRTLHLVHPGDGSVGPGFALGSNNTLTTTGAKVHVQESRFVASGPTSPTVRLDLSLSFNPQAAANGIPVQVRTTADDGRVQGFDHAASLNVRRP